MPIHHCSSLALALIVAGFATSESAHAVRVSADGHGQALIYPYFTARSTDSGNAFVTALAVINRTAGPKALKVRFLESKAGAEVIGFNLFLDAYDVWTAGVVPSGAGAGMFTSDNSCALPKISNSAASPTKFSNAAYTGDQLGDTLDRTYEGYFEILEMGVIDPQSDLAKSVVHHRDLGVANASSPTCANLPVTDAVPAGLGNPTGGLAGNVSYINVNEGTDYGAEATALAQWSDRVQWSGAGNLHPNLADASPAQSYVAAARDDGDVAYLTRWDSGRDAVTAVLQADHVVNDYTVEPNLKSHTDWILTMPTKKFHVNGGGIDKPFLGMPGYDYYPEGTSPDYCEALFLNYTCGEKQPESVTWYDREGQQKSRGVIDFMCFVEEVRLCGSVAAVGFAQDYPANPNLFVQGSVLLSKTTWNIYPGPGFVNGFLDLEIFRLPRPWGSGQKVGLTSPPGATTIVALQSGIVTTNATVTYFGLPIIGFAAQSFANGQIPVGSGVSLSNYGGVFGHKVFRKIEVQQ